MNFMAFADNHSNYWGSEVSKNEVNTSEILVSFYIAGYGFSGILTLAKSIFKFFKLF